MQLLQIRPRALAAGLASFLPVLRGMTNRGSGGTGSARYCYSVWMRHLVRAHEAGLPTDPVCVAELGPGDSLGTGLAAVLCGANRYLALDYKAHAAADANLRVSDDMLALLRQRAAIPDDAEFPAVQPKLRDYQFPAHILGEARLARALTADRIAEIRAAIAGQASGIEIAYMAPWNDPAVIRAGAVDLLLSQAVLEHIDDLETTYHAMREWMKPGAAMSHSIDFSCHNLTRDWNGHWMIGEATWRIVRGTRGYLINREPLSTHLAMLERHGFQPVAVEPRHAEVRPGFRPAGRFQMMSESDRATRGAFVQARLQFPERR